MKSRRESLTIRSSLLPMLAGRVGAAGGDADALFRELRLPAALSAQREIETPLATMREAFEAAEDYLHDPFVGLNLGLPIERGRYGVLEFATRSAPTMAGAVERMVRYQRLVANLSPFSSDRRGQLITIEHRLPGERNGIGRHANEFTIAQVLARVRDLLQAPIAPARVWFPHPEPRDVGALVRHFGTENLTFDASSSGMALDAAVGERRLPTADGPLLQVLDRYAGSLLPPADLPPADPLLRIRAQIRRSVGRGPVSLAAVASAARTSPRTLQRQLEASHTTFQGLLDEVRRDLAFEYLRDPSRTVNEVALSLGYSDGRAFLRAFRRWSDVTPLRYRHRALAASPA